jgi:hypothetical protein
MSDTPDRPSGERPDADEGPTWHTFACPVCGHRDRAPDGPGPTHIQCSHCDTTLEIEVGRPTSERTEARVVREPGGAAEAH